MNIERTTNHNASIEGSSNLAQSVAALYSPENRVLWNQIIKPLEQLPKAFDSFVQFNDDKSSPSYIEESVSTAEIKELESLKKTEKELLEVKKEINKFGKDPKESVVDLMKKNRFLGLGESHLSPNPMRDFGAEIIPELKKAGATHFAIEAGLDTQAAIDEFVRTGKLDRTKLPALARSDDYEKILKAAKDAGLKIVCVDTRGKNRDKSMADNIGAILDADKDNKVVYWVGAAHLSSVYKDHPNGKSCADYLRLQKYSVATVNSEWKESSFSPVMTLTSDLKKTVAIAPGATNQIKDLRTSWIGIGVKGLPEEVYGNFDQIIIFPNPKKK